MKDKFDILNELKQQKFESGFSVPENYFESFEDKMLSVIEAEQTSIVKKIIMVAKPWLSLAAIFILVALIYYTAPILKNSHQLANVSLPNDVSIDFISSSFSESELIDIIVEDEQSTIYEDINTNNELLEGLTIEDIQDLVIF